MTKHDWIHHRNAALRTNEDKLLRTSKTSEVPITYFSLKTSCENPENSKNFRRIYHK